MQEKIVSLGFLDEKWLFLWGKENFMELDGYSWRIGNKTYRFRVIVKNGVDVLNNNLDDIDMLIFPGADLYAKLAIWKWLYPQKHKKWIRNIQNFVKKGRGCIGHCGGANLICELYNEAETFYEKTIKEAYLGIAETKVYQKESLALFDQIAGHPPTALEGAAYPIYDGLGENAPQMGGIPIDLIVKDKKHPILKGYDRETLKIFWGGGPGLIPSNKAKVILSYPEKDIPDLQPLNVWKYVGTGKGGRLGMIIGLLKSIAWTAIEDIKTRREVARSLRNVYLKKLSTEEFVKRLYKKFGEDKADRLFEIIAEGIYKAKDWVKLEQIMPVRRANMAAMVEEEYGDGRVLICGPHPEDPIWENGKIYPLPDTKENCLYEGFMRWKDYEWLNKRNYWFLRREVAWAAGLDEDELPPIPEHKEVIGREEKPHVEKRESFFEILIRFFRRIFEG